MKRPAVDSRIKHMPQVAEVVDGHVWVTCRIGPQPYYHYTFRVEALPIDPEARGTYLRDMSRAACPAFFSATPELAERCVIAQEAAILRVLSEEAA